MKSFKICLFLLMTISVISCNDDDTTQTPSGLIYGYFPVNVGHEIIYDVTSITKDEFSGAEDTLIYQIKEVVESVFLDGSGRVTQRLERYKRDTPNDPWIINDVWTSNMTPSRVEKKEENIPYVKLVFPITSSVTWNGNVLNTEEPKEYEYDNLHVADVVGGINFDSTLTVIQLNFQDSFITQYEVEKYALNVGMIYKEFVEVNKAFPLPGIKSQTLYKETIVSWSN